MNKDIVLLDLFSGIGGFAKGLSDAGFNITTHYFSEIDKHAIAVYKYQFKHSNYVGSVTTVDGGTITRPNIITFGSPCQDFSVAGKRAGMEGQRSSLIGQALRLITECRPDVFIWENVKGVFSSNNSEDFWAIIQAFANIGGYRLEWQLVNTAWFLPQNRERIYLIGHLGTGGGRLVFPFREDDFGLTEGTAKTTTVGYISAGGHSGGMHSGMTLVRHRSDQQYTQGDIALTVRNSDKAEVRIVAQRGRGDDNIQQLEPRKDELTNSLTGIQKDNLVYVPSATKQGFEIATTGDSINLQQPTSKTRRGRVGKGVAQTLDTQEHQCVVLSELRHKHGDDREYTDIAPTIQSRYGTGGDNIPYVNNIRRLTEVECERLQGFPDNWTRYGNYDGVIRKVAKTQRYKMCGNAVTKDVVEAIGKRLLNC